MAVLDEIPADLLPVLLPVGIGVVFVIVTVAVVFWLGSNRQRSFEEAKAQASRQAEEVLRGKEYRNSPRAAAKKGPGRRPRRPKKADQGGEDSQEDTPLSKDDGQPRKSILKVPAPATPATPAAKEATPERSPRSKVGFHLDTPPKADEAKQSRPSPPTPHPSKQQQAPMFAQPPVQRTVQPLFEEPEEEDVTSGTSTSTLVGGVKSKKPHPQTTVPSSGKPVAKKPRVRTKQPLASFDGLEALPASRISDIVMASSLSDEDIQQLMDVLLEKMNTNAEWQEATMRPENVKTLKKQNQDLQNKFEEAQKTVFAHNNKIKELRAEIQNEKMRHQSAENSLQGKITSQNNDLSIARAKMTGLEEELKQTKAQSSAETMEKLQEENTLLQKTVASTETVATSQKAALESQAKQMKELEDTISTLKTDLQRAKSSLSNEPKLKEKVSELEGCVDSIKQQNTQLQTALEKMSRDNASLQGEVQVLGPLREERDTLKQKASSLEADNANLRAELDVARQNSDSSLQANSEALQVELERKSTEEVARVRQELSSQHQREMDELRGTIAHLEGSHGDKDRELDDLRVQIEKCSSLETQLKAVSEQLQHEQGSKKELQIELESLRSSANSGTGNGPVDVPEEGGVGGEELAKVEGERDDLKLQVKELENKLDDLKTKNNTLRDSCWKAKDEAASIEKACEEKLKAARIETEKRCKSIKTETLEKAREEQQSFLKQLFPSIKIDTDEPSKWMDEFEVKVEELLEDYRDQISNLQSEVEDLQENGQGTSGEEAEQIRTTLETTMSILEKLQSEVVKQTKVAKEKDVMIEREKASNRSLQEQLKNEKDASARLQQQLDEAGSATGGGDMESRLSEVEERLKETEREKDGYKDEVGNLHSSLDREVEAKDRAQQQAEEWEKQLKQLNEKVTSETEQRQTSEKKCQELEEELSGARKKLLETEQMVEIMKDSNRELNATIHSLSPTRKSNNTESEV